jgi:chromosome segregation ATPase
LVSQLEEKKHLSNELLDSHQTEIQILSEQNKKIESDYQNTISQIEILKEKLSEKETQLEENNCSLKQIQKEEGEEQDLMKKIREIKEEVSSCKECACAYKIEYF